MGKNWKDYLDEDDDDNFKKVERIRKSTKGEEERRPEPKKIKQRKPKPETDFGDITR